MKKIVCNEFKNRKDKDEIMTKTEWQELCESDLVGFKREIVDSGFMNGCKEVWYREDDEKIYPSLPPQDMNTIFRWVIPKFLEPLDLRPMNHAILSAWITDFTLNGKENPFELLAQKLLKAMKERKECQN